MFGLGDIVYNNNLIFGDNMVDKKSNRPCIVLFEAKNKNKTYVGSCPLTSNLRSFNKKPDNYTLLSEPLKHYNQLSFVKLNSINISPLQNLRDTGMSISQKEAERILKLFLSNLSNPSFENLNLKDCKEFKQILTYLNLFIELEEKEKQFKKFIN